MNVIMSIDAGGTLFKSALVESDTMQVLPATNRDSPSNSSLSSETVLGSLYSVVDELMALKDTFDNPTVERIVFSFPGPFDYSNGRCLMKHKFQNIYGVPLAPLIRKYCNIPLEVPIHFHHDLHAFTYGAYLYEMNHSPSRNLFCVAIGTGLGTGFLQHGRLEMGPGGIPKYPLFQKKYNSGILEDVVSNRGLVDLYHAYSGNNEPVDAKDIQLRADMHNDMNAFKAYKKMGEVLGKALSPLLYRLEIDTLIIGGQISKGFHLFGPEMNKYLDEVATLRCVEPVSDVVTTTIRGAASIPVSVYESYFSHKEPSQ